VQFENFLCFQILDAHNASLIYHMSWKEFLSLNTKIANFRYTQSYLNKNQWFYTYFSIAVFLSFISYIADIQQ